MTLSNNKPAAGSAPLVMLLLVLLLMHQHAAAASVPATVEVFTVDYYESEESCTGSIKNTRLSYVPGQCIADHEGMLTWKTTCENGTLIMMQIRHALVTIYITSQRMISAERLVDSHHLSIHARRIPRTSW